MVELINFHTLLPVEVSHSPQSREGKGGTEDGMDEKKRWLAG